MDPSRNRLASTAYFAIISSILLHAWDGTHYTSIKIKTSHLGIGSICPRGFIVRGLIYRGFIIGTFDRLPCKTTVSQLRLSFCSSFHSYCERIEQIPNPSAHPVDCRVEPHTTVHVSICYLHPTPLTERDLWERPRAQRRFFMGAFYFYLTCVFLLRRAVWCRVAWSMCEWLKTLLLVLQRSAVWCGLCVNAV